MEVGPLSILKSETVPTADITLRWIFGVDFIIMFLTNTNIILFLTQLLLERGASVEAKDEDGAIPLHDACAGGIP